MKISLATSEWLKGIAILLMLAHHLFGLPGLIEPPSSYTPLIAPVPLEYWIGRFGKICVAVFLLVSGYGFAAGGRGQGARYFGAKAWRFLLAYWPYFVLAYTVGLLFFQERMANGNLRFPTDPAGIALNALTLKNTMAFEWWFAETYLLLVLATPLLLRATGHRIAMLTGSAALFALGSAMDMTKFDLPVLSLANLFIWQLPWVVGMLLAGPLPVWLLRLITSRAVTAGLLAAMLAGFAGVEALVPFAMTPFLIIAAPAFVVSLVALVGACIRRASHQQPRGGADGRANAREGIPARAARWSSQVKPPPGRSGGGILDGSDFFVDRVGCRIQIVTRASHGVASSDGYQQKSGRNRHDEFASHKQILLRAHRHEGGWAL